MLRNVLWEVLVANDVKMFDGCIPLFFCRNSALKLVHCSLAAHANVLCIVCDCIVKLVHHCKKLVNFVRHFAVINVSQSFELSLFTLHVRQHCKTIIFLQQPIQLPFDDEGYYVQCRVLIQIAWNDRLCACRTLGTFRSVVWKTFLSNIFAQL